MKNIVLIRHGPIAEEFKNKFYGQLDVELSPEGKRESEKVVNILSSFDIKAVFSSPLKRALYPARLLAKKTGIPLFIRDELKEINYGDWTGKPREEVYKEALFWQRLKNDTLSPPNGESLRDLRKRAFSFWKEISLMPIDGLIIVFSHGGFIRALFCELFGIESQKFFSFEIYHLKGNFVSLYEDGNFVLRGLNIELEQIPQILASTYF